MKQTKFKILTHCGMYVDEHMLEQGIYAAHKPYIHDIDSSIESMVDLYMNMADKFGGAFYSPSSNYIENLKSCKLITIEINEMQDTD